MKKLLNLNWISIQNCMILSQILNFFRATLSNLQFLVLRCNHINNDIIKDFCNSLKNNETN